VVASGGLIERLEDVLFAVRFGLLAGDGVAGLRVEGGKCDHIMRAEGSDASGQHGLGVFAQADFTGDVAGDALVLGASHKAQGFVDPGLGEQVQIGRLLELRGQRLLQRAVEDAVAGGVDEVGKQDGVFFSESGGLTGAEIECAPNQREYDDCSDACEQGPARFLRRGNGNRGPDARRRSRCRRGSGGRRHRGHRRG